MLMAALRGSSPAGLDGGGLVVLRGAVEDRPRGGGCQLGRDYPRGEGMRLPWPPAGQLREGQGETVGLLIRAVQNAEDYLRTYCSCAASTLSQDRQDLPAAEVRPQSMPSLPCRWLMHAIWRPPPALRPRPAPPGPSVGVVPRAPRSPSRPTWSAAGLRLDPSARAQLSCLKNWASTGDCCG